MKVLLFTHKIDIDGMGSAVLAKLVYQNVDIIYLDTFEINEKLQEKINNNSIYAYDQIFITDICPNELLIQQISNDERLKDKFLILDHHISMLENLSKPYKIANIKVENKFGKCSGTSLFYDYLISHLILNETPVIKQFVELTRQYDTWEWKTKYNNEDANNLNIMFSILGRNNYVESCYNKLANNLELFDESDIKKIANFKSHQKQICEDYISSIHVEKVNGFACGVFDNMQDEYKNDVAEMLKENNFLNIDYVAMFIANRNTLSFRSIKQDFSVREVAESFGGKGHKPASSCALTDEVKEAFKLKI